MEDKIEYKCKIDDDLEEMDEYEEEEDHFQEIVVSYACEDCDYRWEVTFEDEEDEEINESQYCPMCGSQNTTQI